MENKNLLLALAGVQPAGEGAECPFPPTTGLAEHHRPN